MKTVLLSLFLLVSANCFATDGIIAAIDPTGNPGNPATDPSGTVYTTNNFTAQGKIKAVATPGFTGDASGLSAIPGANITSGTVNSNALDAATKAQLALAGSGGGGSNITGLDPIVVTPSAGNAVVSFTGSTTNQFARTNGTGPITAGAFNGDGRGLTSVQATNITHWPFFNVMDFGAKGDGVTDDTTAIRNCLTAATNVGAGGEVLFPTPLGGFYKVTGTFTIVCTNIYIHGAGGGSSGGVNSGTVISTTLSNQPIFLFTNCSGITLRDLTVKCSAANCNNSLINIGSTALNTAWLENLWFINGGAYCGELNKSTLRGLQFINCVDRTAGVNLTIENKTFDDAGDNVLDGCWFQTEVLVQTFWFSGGGWTFSNDKWNCNGAANSESLFQMLFQPNFSGAGPGGTSDIKIISPSCENFINDAIATSGAGNATNALSNLQITGGNFLSTVNTTDFPIKLQGGIGNVATIAHNIFAGTTSASYVQVTAMTNVSIWDNESADGKGNVTKSGAANVNIFYNGVLQ